MDSGTSTLCDLCKRLSLEEMQGHKTQPHQPSYFALKESVKRGCQLCRFILTALGQCKSVDGDELVSGAQVLEHVSEKYPGREISFLASGLVSANRDTSYLDYMDVYTSGEVPDCDSEDDMDDPTLHPDYQLALSGRLHIFADDSEHKPTMLSLGSLYLQMLMHNR